MTSTSSVTPHGAISAASANPKTVTSGVGVGGLLPFLPKEGDTTASLLAEAESFKSQFEKSKNKGEEIPAKGSSKLASALLPFALKNKDGNKTKESKKLPSHAEAANVVPLSIMPSIPDTRSWALSFRTTPNKGDETTGGSSTATLTTPAAPTNDLKHILHSGAPDSAKEHALQRTEIAFTVTVPPATEEQGKAAAATTKSTSATAKETKADSPSVEKAKPTPGTPNGAPAVKGTAALQNGSSARDHAASSEEGHHSNTAKKGSHDEATSASSTTTIQARQRDNAYASSSRDSVHAGTSAPAAHTAEQSSPAATAAVAAPAQMNNTHHKADGPNTASGTSAVSDEIKPITVPKPQSIDLKVGQADGSQVDVRVSQRAGDVQVTVRTADGDLAQSLRHHLPELSDRLAQNGTPGDFWQPSSAQGSSPQFSETDHRDSSAEGNGSHGRGDGQRENNHSQSGNGDENNPEAAWYRELTNATQTRH